MKRSQERRCEYHSEGETEQLLVVDGERELDTRKGVGGGEHEEGWGLEWKSVKGISATRWRSWMGLVEPEVFTSCSQAGL